MTEIVKPGPDKAPENETKVDPEEFREEYENRFSIVNSKKFVGMLEIAPVRGRLPDMLKGMFTSRNFAETKINAYIASRPQ